MKIANAYAADCPTRQILDRVGDKWAVLILLLVRDEPMRFTVPSPGPRPSQPPRRMDSSAVSTWKVSPDCGDRKRSMRPATCGSIE